MLISIPLVTLKVKKKKFKKFNEQKKEWDKMDDFQGLIEFN